jgi:MOSC domain-containing protein YiiM
MLVGGVQLAETQGAQIRIGELFLEVTGQTAPCSRMEEAQPGLQTALIPEWRGGVTCRVISGGRVRIGDQVEILRPA